MTRRAPVLAEYHGKDADKYIFAFHGRLLRVPRSAVQEVPGDAIVTYSLIFSLVTDPPAQQDLVVQLDEHPEGQYTQSADPSKTLLDIGPGDGLIHQWGGRP